MWSYAVSNVQLLARVKAFKDVHSGDAYVKLLFTLLRCIIASVQMYIVLKDLHVRSNFRLCGNHFSQDCQLRRSLGAEESVWHRRLAAACRVAYVWQHGADEYAVLVRDKNRNQTLLQDFYLVKAHTPITVGQTSKFTFWTSTSRSHRAHTGDDVMDISIK